MIVNNDTAEKDGNNDNIKSSLKNGELTTAELQVCAMDIIKFLAKTLVAERKLRPLNNIPVFAPKAENQNAKNKTINF